MSAVPGVLASIPMRDGCRLSATIWRAQREVGPVPAVLEYLPYRKDDFYAATDAHMFGWWARNEYVGVKVDIRGTGNSEGIHEDEYSEQETRDCLEVIDWIRRQPWCDGRVGMFGLSYGGINALQVAARRPPGLRAIVSVGATDDRFGGDVHRIGGCVHDTGFLWASSLLAFDALPPHPDVFGPHWRRVWMDRLEQSRPPLHRWLAHQSRDGYWRHGSACEDYGAIDCAVYLVSGWADRYSDSALRFLANHTHASKGLIGPWEHAWPHEATIGPAVDFLGEMKRWFDHWLRDEDNGIMDEPRLQTWIDAPRGACKQAREGRWQAHRLPLRPRAKRLYLSDRGTLREVPAPTGTASVRSDVMVGHAAGESSPFAAGERAGEQRDEDARSLCFDSEPLSSPLTLLGRARVHLELACDSPVGLLACRLCAVATDGSSQLITRGLLNLTHRDGSANPAPLARGATYRVRVPLMATGYELPAGSRLRLAVSGTYWPWAWPPAVPFTVACVLGEHSCLELALAADHLDAAEWLRTSECSGQRGSSAPHEPAARQVRHTDIAGITTTNVESTSGVLEIGERGLVFRSRSTTVSRLDVGDPLSAAIEIARDDRVSQGPLASRVLSRTSVTTNGAQFNVRTTLEAFDHDVKVFDRTWQQAIPRHLV